MSRTKDAAEESVSKFYSKHGFPQCIGAIDGSHHQKVQQIVSIEKNTIK